MYPEPRPAAHDENERLKAWITARVDHLRAVPHRHGKLFRVGWAAAGIVLVVAGLFMTVLPGPAIIVIPMGLAMLAGSFSWARRLLRASIHHGVELERWFAHLPVEVKVVAAAIAVCLTGAVAVLVLR